MTERQRDRETEKERKRQRGNVTQSFVIENLLYSWYFYYIYAGIFPLYYYWDAIHGYFLNFF